jgi:hypothetical protein
MKERENLRRLSGLALRKRRRGLLQQFPPLAETLRGSVVERYLTCGKPNCQCAQGKRHGPVWCLTVTLGPGRSTGQTLTTEQAGRVRGWIRNYQQVKERLEKISDINRELLRREPKPAGREQGRKEPEAGLWGLIFPLLG